MTRRRLTALLTAAALAATTGAAAAETDGPKAGIFSAPFAEDPTFDARPPQTNEEAKRVPPAVHLSMLPDGRVAYWGALQGAEDLVAPAPLDYGRAVKPASSRILDLRSGTPRWSAPGNNTGGPRADEDLFCADQRLLPDGRLLAVGGSVWANDPVDLTGVVGDGGPGGTLEVFASDAARWLDHRSDRPAWTGGEAHRMHKPRWYPTLVTLPDGRALAASGVERLIYNVPGIEQGRARNVRELEVFDHRTNRWAREPRSGDISLPLYPRMHVTHDGKVLYTGSGIMWSPFGEAYDEALWNVHRTYDPDTHRWAISGVSPFGARSDPFSVALMMRPPYDRNRILVAGGTLGVSPGTYLATDLSEIITYRDGHTSSAPTAPLNHRRWFSSGVLLPSGEVLALAGGDRNANVAMGTDAAVRQVELFDPATGRWTALATAERERTYHSAAILLPDGRVLLGGHAPQAAMQQDHPTSNAGLTAPNLKDPSFEIYTPPYLDPARGPQPELTHAAAGMRYGTGSYTVKARGDVEKIVLVRLPSTTHVFDPDQRGVELPFEAIGAGTLRVSTPPDANVAPPGHYYLFALSAAGVPSKARIVQVGAQLPSLAPAPAPFGT